MDPSDESERSGTVYRCRTAARWLPRALAGSVLAAALLATGRIDPQAVLSGSRGFRTAVVVLAAILAIWILRRGGEVRLRVRVDGRSLRFEYGGQLSTLRLAEVDALRYDAPFGVSRSWLPAAVLIDRAGKEWRLPALLHAGDRLIESVLEGSGEEKLQAWTEALGLRRRMSRVAARVRLGYFVAGAILSVGLLYYVH